MEAIIKNELFGGVFLHEDFWNEFLPCVTLYQEGLRDRVNDIVLRLSDSRWTFNRQCFTSGNEEDMYAPLANLLNVIGEAAFHLFHTTQTDQFRPSYQPFSDHSKGYTESDYPSDNKMQPDLVKAERTKIQGSQELQGAHWGDIEMVVECKSFSEQGSQNQAYLQLARYAHAIFAHQIYRLHVFGVAVCGPIVTFVRFDRSGLLHSPELDLRQDADIDQFVRRMISLLTLPPEKFGYDPRYTFRFDENKRHQLLFALEGHAPRVVNGLLCHRKCCRGRATLVSCLSAVRFSESQGAEIVPTEPFLDSEIVHKRIWRNKERTDEGTTLSRFRGVFGVCQVIAFRDGTYTTQVQSPSSLKHSRAASLFVPTKFPGDGSPTNSSATHTSISMASSTNPASPFSTFAEAQGEFAAIHGEAIGPDHDAIINEGSRGELLGQTGKARSQSIKSYDSELFELSPKLSRDVRVASNLLMPKGTSLFQAQSSIHLLYAIHDTLLGIMAFAEAGMMHRDISADNILLIKPGEHYKGTGEDWTKHVVGSLGESVWDCLASELLPDIVDQASTNQGTSCRQTYVQNLCRGPLAVLCDAEHAVKEKRDPKEVHHDRTGTPAFISAQLLQEPTRDGPPVARTFIHDIESLMWVLIWMVVHQPSIKPTQEAQRYAHQLSQHDLSAVADFKKSLILRHKELRRTISAFGNPWAIDLAPVIEKMARFFAIFLYFEDPSLHDSPEHTQDPQSFPPGYVNLEALSLDKLDFEQDYDELFGELQAARADHAKFRQYDRGATFHYFTQMFRTHLRSLANRGQFVKMDKL